MKQVLLGTAVGLVVLVLVIFFVAGREPTPDRPGQSATTAVQQQPSTAGSGNPPTAGATSGGSARAERGSGVEGVSSGGTTTAPGGTADSLKR